MSSLNFEELVNCKILNASTMNSGFLYVEVGACCLIFGICDGCTDGKSESGV